MPSKDKSERPRQERRAEHTGAATPGRNVSWLPGRKGQGGEGLSKGYGGSRGRGTEASGPEGARQDAGSSRNAKRGRGARAGTRTRG